MKKKLVKLLQFTKIILNTYLENLWKKERCEERKSENEVFGLDFSDSMQGFFFFLLFLDSFSSQKKLGWGKKLALKIWNGRHFIRFTCFLFCSSEKIWTANFPVAISRDFFLPFLLPKFSVAQPSPLHYYTHRKQQYGCGERSELHCASHSYSQQKYTLGLPDRKIFTNICYSIYTVKSRAVARLG